MSVQNKINEHHVLNSIRLQMRHELGKNKIWIIVEGITDQNLFERLLKSEKVAVNQSYAGLKGLIFIVQELLKETDKVIGIRDADFTRLTNNIKSEKNVFLTDCHDTEMMLISADNTYLSVVIECRVSRDTAIETRQKIQKSIIFIGGLKWMNDVDDLELNFKNLGLSDFYNPTLLSLDAQGYLDAVMKRSPNKKKSVSLDDVNRQISSIDDLLNLCNGHDFLNALSLYINSNPLCKHGIGIDEIGRLFRLAYGFMDFKNTELFKKLSDWESRTGHHIFNT